MKNNFMWLSIATLCLGFASCQKTDDPTIDIPKQFSEVTLEEGKNTQTITIEANKSWEVIISDTKATEVEWLTVTPLKGNAGKATLTITAKDNFSRDQRTTYLKISVDGLIKTIPIKQLAAITVIEDDELAAKVPSNGFYVANEDWFGHDNGTVNYFKKEGVNYTATYRAYRAVNPTQTDWFGSSTSHATTWGDNIYFSSKQGNRLVVAEANSLKKRAITTELGGDGRSFVGVNDTKGYVGHSKGIAVFDIAQLQISKQIEGISGQIGTMGSIGGRVFAVSQNNGLYVINATTDVLEQTIAGSYNTLAISKDGNVWVAGADKLIKLNPTTLEKVEIDYPAGAKIGNSWGAWNAGTMCASTQQNVLYWGTGGGMFGGAKTIVKYDIETQTANTSFYTLGKSEFDTQLELYGAGMRIDPLTDQLVLTAKHSGWGASGAFNWIYIIDANGQEVTNFKVKGDNGTGLAWSSDAADWDEKYFWFPAMPFFEDANKPQILLNQVLLKVGEKKEINLNQLVVDYDNIPSSIQKSITLSSTDLATAKIEGDKLMVEAAQKAGKTTATLTVISNGVKVSKNIRIDIEK